MTAPEIKTSLIEALSAEADGRFASAGFSRSAKSTVFVRKLPDAVQSFDYSLAVRPRYARGALAHVYPRLRLSMPLVCQMAGKLVAGNPVLLANAPHIMVNRPFDHFVPKSERAPSYVFHKDEFGGVARDVAESWINWGLPFFGDYRGAEDIVRGFEQGDRRPHFHANWPIFVAAAYLVLERSPQAESVIGSAFSSPGARRKYSAVFANLGNILESDGSERR